MNRIYRPLLWAGILGPVQFIVVDLIEGATRPGYNPIRHPVSSLSLTNAGWVNSVSITVNGLLVMLFALGVWAALRPARRTLGPLVLGLAGLGFVVAGVFTTDPAQGYPPGVPGGPALIHTLHGQIHYYNAVPTFGFLIIAFVTFALYFRSTGGWRGWSLYSAATAFVLLVCCVGFAISSAHDGPAGLIERILLGLACIWIILLAVRLLVRGGFDSVSEPTRTRAGMVTRSSTQPC